MTRWEDVRRDATFAAVAEAAWPEDWRHVAGEPGNARAAARARLTRRREGFRAAGAVLAELGRIESRSRGLERSLTKVNVAAKALRYELVTLGILAGDELELDDAPPA